MQMMMIMNHLELQVVDFDAWSLLCLLPTYLSTYTCTAWDGSVASPPGSSLHQQVRRWRAAGATAPALTYDKKTTMMQKLRKHFGWRLTLSVRDHGLNPTYHLQIHKRKDGNLERKKTPFGHHQPTVFTPIDAIKFKVQHMRTGGQGLTQIPTSFRTFWRPDSVRTSGTLYGCNCKTQG